MYETNSLNSLQNSPLKHKKISNEPDSYALIDLMKEVTGCEPKMWGPSIIGFDQYHYKYESGREGKFLKVGFSPRKRELSIYLMCSLEKNDDLLSKLGKHRTGKSCLYVKRLEDINMDVLKDLVQESVKFVDEKYG